MPWDTYFAILLQIIIASFILALPVAFFVFTVTGAATSGMFRSVRKFIHTLSEALKKEQRG